MVEISYLGILAGGIASMVLGMIWYSPQLFGKQWMAALGLSAKDMEKYKNGMMKRYFISFLSSLALTFVLDNVVTWSGATTLMQGAVTGFWVWLGFFATTTYSGILWEGKSMTWYYVTAGYQLVQLLILGEILTMV